MKASQGFFKIIQNERGILTTDVIFALAIAVGMICLLFCLTFTLSVAEVAQYIAFSSARAHAAGHVDVTSQQAMATAKFTELMSNVNIKPLFTGDNPWFSLTHLEIKSGSGSGNPAYAGEFSGYPPGIPANRVPQEGVRLTFTSTIMDFKMPLLGSTTSGSDTTTFSAKVTAFIFREPAQSECQQQMGLRYSAILALDARFKTIPEQSSGASAYVPLEDNGC